ncbi:MAG: hypothetical protein Q8K60_00380, partial [Parachlamydiaceae bacterium]|nr:hypothetical protein [Parachlamydiaceae bacterium]
MKYLTKYLSCLITVSWFAAYNLTQAQVNIESVAKLQAEVSANSKVFFEGYNSIVSGTYTAYESHRSGNKRDTSYVSRTSGSESTIEWKTAFVPASVKNSSVSFIWTCGFGNNLGSEVFDLYVNDELSLTF